MPRAIAKPCVRTVVLDQMADVADAVRAAPVADLLRVVFCKKPTHHVHKDVARRNGSFSGVIPEARQHFCKIPAPPRAQCAQKLLRPWQDEPFAAAFRAAARAAGKRLIRRGVSEARLVGEKSGDGFSELRAVVRIMRLVYIVQERGHRLPLQRVEIVPRFRLTAASRLHQQEQPPASLRNIPV